jgi:hypothetical protein
MILPELLLLDTSMFLLAFPSGTSLEHTLYKLYESDEQ